METTNIQIGDIYEYTWGYDQTNVNFYQIVAKTRSMVTLVEINKQRTPTCDMQGNATPAKGSFIANSLIRKKIQPDSHYGHIMRMSSGILVKWDGRPVSYSCYA